MKTVRFAGACLLLLMASAVPTRGATSDSADSGPLASGSTEPAPPGQEAAQNDFDRSTPRQTIEGFLAASDRGDDRQAAAYLATWGSSGRQREAAARQLRTTLDRQVWIDPQTFSADSVGNLNDGLAADRESIGWIDTTDGPRQLLLQRVQRDGAKRWLFASDSIAAAVKVYDDLGYGRWTELLPAPLLQYQLLHVQLWQWIALLLVVVIAYPVAWLVVRVARWILAPLTRRTRTAIDDNMLVAAAGPARLLIGVALFSAARLPLGLTAAADTVLGRVEYFLVVVAVTWLALRTLDVLAEVLRGVLVRRGQGEVMNLVPPGRRTAQLCLIVLASIAMLDGLGFNITALLAGLGVGGLAIALAAQKSIENLLGGISLFADRPVRVGDFCRFGGTVGTIEDIGLRSTRVRTLERCVVSVPNAEFANLQLENFSLRDKFWYHPTIGLRYETTPDQLRYILVEVRRMLYAHEKVDPSPARIRFTGFGASSLDLEVFAYVLAANYDEYLEVAEDLNLRIMDLINAAGSSFAFPSRTLYVESGAGLDGERAARAERQVAQWRERSSLYLPRFPAEKISELHGSLRYPPPGAPEEDTNHRSDR
ncbi:MAG: mechanosensitive ion channel domain-containing protein [bacterium]